MFRESGESCLQFPPPFFFNLKQYKQAITSALKIKEKEWTYSSLICYRPLCSSRDAEKSRQRRRRGKISVNLLRLVWEFEEGGEV